MISRIHLLPATLADQIAAGEVVERPSSVVKELVENAVDAGARRVDVELEAAGLELVRVSDDGRGIHPDDLELAVTRHATSKIREPRDLVEIETLGFRGEALASIAAVASVTIRSRLADATIGSELQRQNNARGAIRPVGMALGTQVEVQRLFERVPARRKFMRSEATEVGQCMDAVLAIALVHSHVHFGLRHGARELLSLPATHAEARIEQILGRRACGSLVSCSTTHDGIAVRAWLAAPDQASRSRGGTSVVVRRRVVRERNLVHIVAQAYGARLEPGTFPVACIFVDPPHGDLDVNVHPQKTEVRFREPQRVYAAVRAVLNEVVVSARSWPATNGTDGARQHACERTVTGDIDVPDTESPVRQPNVYKLSTRALDDDYGRYKRDTVDYVDELRRRTEPAGAYPSEAADGPVGAPQPSLLTCLRGPVAVFELEGDLLAVDLRQLRAYLVGERIARELNGGCVTAQVLLTPVVVSRRPEEVAMCVDDREELSKLGIELEGFGSEALLVRAVPAQLQYCVDQADVGDLIEKVLGWLRLRSRSKEAAVQAIASTNGVDPSTRFARRWVTDLLSARGSLEGVPGVRRWKPGQLLEEA